jgi:hypothetical protein
MSNAELCAEHAWRELTEAEVGELRTASRSGRPSGAWLEGAEQCERCGRTEARVSQWGQIKRVPVSYEGASVKVAWYDRGGATGGATGMGSERS